MISTKKQGKLKMILFTCLIIILTIFLIFGFRIYQLNSISKGKSIPESRKNQVLIVLDIQNDTLAIPQYKNSKTLLQNINNVVEDAQTNNIPIIYSMQESTNPIDKILTGGRYTKNTEGINLSNDLSVVSNNIFTKDRNDIFSNKAFESFLEDNNIGELYLVGADASSCVLKSTEAALNRKYKVVILKDCLFSVNSKYLNDALSKYEEKGAMIGNKYYFNKL